MLRAFSVLVLSGLIATFAMAASVSGPAPAFKLQSRDGTMRFIHHGYKPGYEGEYQTQVRALLKE